MRLLVPMTIFLTITQIGMAISRLQSDNSAIDALSIVTSIIWALTFTWLTISLIKRKEQSANRALWVLNGFVLYSALRLLIFTQADYDRQRLPLVLMIALIIFVTVQVIIYMQGTENVYGE